MDQGPKRLRATPTEAGHGSLEILHASILARKEILHNEDFKDEAR